MLLSSHAASAEPDGAGSGASRLAGEWRSVPTAEGARTLCVLDIGLRGSPSKRPGCSESGLSEQERLGVLAVRKAVNDDPRSKQVIKWRYTLQVDGEIRYVFSAGRRQMFLGQIPVFDGTYVVVSSDGSRIVLDVTPVEPAPMNGHWAPTREEYTLLDDKTLLAYDETRGTTLTYVRVK